SWVETPSSIPAPAGEHFLFAGALRREKRPGIFLDAAERLPDRRFVLLGGPGSSAERAIFDLTERRARSIPNLALRGAVPPPEVAEAMRRAIALVNTSEYEGFPNAFLEAWAHGVPVVSVHADPDELICTLQLGLHTRSDEALPAALREIADDPGRAAAM